MDIFLRLIGKMLDGAAFCAGFAAAAAWFAYMFKIMQ